MPTKAFTGEYYYPSPLARKWQAPTTKDIAKAWLTDIRDKIDEILEEIKNN